MSELERVYTFVRTPTFHLRASGHRLSHFFFTYTYRALSPAPGSPLAATLSARSDEMLSHSTYIYIYLYTYSFLIFFCCFTTERGPRETQEMHESKWDERIYVGTLVGMPTASVSMDPSGSPPPTPPPAHTARGGAFRIKRDRFFFAHSIYI